MRTPRNTEPQANGALARALRRHNPDWNDRTVHAERTQIIQQAGPGAGMGRRPDILIAPPHGQPVIIETEFAPAHTVDQDANGRLGSQLQQSGGDIEGVLSVVLPESLKTGDLETVDRAAFRYATHYLDATGQSKRWPPERDWLEGGVDDLANADRTPFSVGAAAGTWDSNSRRSCPTCGGTAGTSLSGTASAGDR